MSETFLVILFVENAKIKVYIFFLKMDVRYSELNCRLLN